MGAVSVRYGSPACFLQDRVYLITIEYRLLEEVYYLQQLFSVFNNSTVCHRSDSQSPTDLSAMLLPHVMWGVSYDERRLRGRRAIREQAGPAPPELLIFIKSARPGERQQLCAIAASDIFPDGPQALSIE